MSRISNGHLTERNKSFFKSLQKMKKNVNITCLLLRRTYI